MKTVFSFYLFMARRGRFTKVWAKQNIRLLQIEQGAKESGAEGSNATRLHGVPSERAVSLLHNSKLLVPFKVPYRHELLLEYIKSSSFSASVPCSRRWDCRNGARDIAWNHCQSAKQKNKFDRTQPPSETASEAWWAKSGFMA